MWFDSARVASCAFNIFNICIKIFPKEAAGTYLLGLYLYNVKFIHDCPEIVVTKKEKQSLLYLYCMFLPISNKEAAIDFRPSHIMLLFFPQAVHQNMTVTECLVQRRHRGVILAAGSAWLCLPSVDPVIAWPQQRPNSCAIVHPP
ncbi:hypothetical protein GOODEAATRI_022056 [Goodea atripinnis]|uniref:Uncharacterized protein n=1 Tax=Goodea atripinnis TaxID=208336 RepID=A0ABV0Q030_9TELE